MKIDDNEYLETFHWIVISGLTCGLERPLEWLVNAVRTPGLTMQKTYYSRIKKHIPRFLVDIFIATSAPLGAPKDSKQVMDMCDETYPKGHWCHDFFLPFKDDVDAYIKFIEEKNRGQKC